MALVNRETRTRVDWPTRRIIKNERLPVHIEESFIEIPSLPGLFQLVEREVVRRLRKVGWPQDKIDEFWLAVSEALNNAVYHGNYGVKHDHGEGGTHYNKERKDAQSLAKNRKKRVLIEFLSLTKSGVTVRVSDEGLGFDYQKLRDPFSAENQGSESGMGRFIMHQMCDRVEYEKPGNRVVLYKKSAL